MDVAVSRKSGVREVLLSSPSSTAGCPRLTAKPGPRVLHSTLYGALSVSLSRGPSRPTCLQVSGKYQFPFSLARAQVRFCETHATHCDMKFMMAED
jgi:hypothetical protein